MTVTTGPVSIVAVRTVGVPASDQERTLVSYLGVLGFHMGRDVPFGEGQWWIDVAPAEGATTIAITAPGDSRVGIDTGIRLTTADAGADHAALTAFGVGVDPQVLRCLGVPPRFSLRDPDGNCLDGAEAVLVILRGASEVGHRPERRIRQRAAAGTGTQPCSTNVTPDGPATRVRDLLGLEKGEFEQVLDGRCQSARQVAAAPAPGAKFAMMFMTVRALVAAWRYPTTTPAIAP